ncbi:efflux RND transporter periplasmic adaptor subunit [Kordiimonas marina]|uniref:efflux RND transporter periplasmic adaptor subunit n=1 Tax=Kordiimonas marina TaxID=2872312 RepID=UPI001FF254DB|nr:efflux RND transporter periplasmic adaptor subunit [Kordiimonas marina]MCJ9427709.1 efflux RND transporter periplasmic adaptor subunit [Kordiimonas marina]
MGDKSHLLNQLKIDREPEPEKKGLSPVWLVAVALVAGGGGAYIGFESAGDSTASAKQTPATTEPQKADTASSAAMADTPTPPTTPAVADNRILNASGYITARRIATVSAKVLGLLTDVNVEEGMAVKTGQVLARLDDSIASADYKLAEAQVVAAKARKTSAEAKLQEAERVLKRATELKTNDFSTEASVTRASADVESLKAELKSAAADIQVAEFQAERQKEVLDEHTIRAPFDGIVTVKAAQPGEIVSPSSAGGGFTRTGICTIVDMDSLEIEVDVNEAYIHKVKAGQKVDANLDAYPDWTIPATVIAIIPTADRAKATVRVRIRIDDKDPRILPDMGVKVAFLKS